MFDRSPAWTFLALTSLLSSPALADNGALAHAYPLRGIRIDGRLDDWPADLPRYAVSHLYTGKHSGKDDFHAEFRVGYSVARSALFVALEVVDDSHVLDPAGKAAWSDQDSHTLYIDPTHSRRGSGSMLFTAVGARRRLLGLERGWDPLVAKASWNDARVAVTRTGNTTVYEWEVRLVGAIRAGRSLGIDHLVADADAGEKPNASTLVAWGRSGAKSRGASRCADVILMAPDERGGKLSGTLGWRSGTDGPFPKRVRIAHRTRRDLWVHIDADGKGHYEVELPAGDYVLRSPFKVYGGLDEIAVMDTSVSVEATVRPGASTRAPKLELATLPPPDLLQTRGVLFDFDETKAADVDAFLAAYMRYYHVPGVSIALIKDAAVVYHRALGLKNYYSREPVTDDTLFEAASITKIVFAFAVNRMAERGEIDLDRPLCEYLPFEQIAHDPRYEKITARLVLSHQTGFPNWAWMNDDGKIDIKFDPGTKFGYSGEGFEYLGRVVAHLRKKSLEEVVLEEVQKPMGFVHNTFFGDCPELRDVVGHGHYTTRTTASYLPDGLGVAHSMHTEARALANFMIGLMQRKGLEPHSYEKMLTPIREVPRSNGDRGPRWKRSFGLGFSLAESPYGLVFGHGGNNGDFRCQLEIYRDHKMGFVVFTNSSEGGHLCEALRRFLIVGSGRKGS